jgi:peptide/nickel transport system ATP-binding protein
MLSQRGAVRGMSGAPTQGGEEILSVRNLHTHFFTYAGVVKALNGFDLQVHRAEMSALVGESGSGKSVAAWSLLGLPKAPGRIVEGEVQWHGQDILRMSKERLKRLRGSQISLILSSPRSNLHPLLRVGDQIQAVHQAHHRVPRLQARETTLATLRAVGLDPNRVFDAYPHELSGGMAQRIIIAAALINSPELVLADDATNGLDVTVQRQVLDLMTQLIQQRRSSALMITHDLGIVAQYCNRATVMYAGQAVEVASTKRLFDNPLHPYTQALLGAIRSKAAVQRKPLPGLPPDPMALPTGCFLQPRCPVRRPECAQIQPTLRQVERGHWVRCILYPELKEAASANKAGFVSNNRYAAEVTSTHESKGPTGGMRSVTSEKCDT